MNDGLGFFFFVFAPLFGLWQFGFVIGLVILLLRRWLVRGSRPDYLYFFLNGLASSAAVIEVGLFLIRQSRGDGDTSVRYAWGAGLLSAATWILWSLLVWAPEKRSARVRTCVRTVIFCIIMAMMIIFQFGFPGMGRAS